MNLIHRIVLGFVKLALVVGITGGLADLTRGMRTEAARAQKHGIVSLKLLNHILIGP